MSLSLDMIVPTYKRKDLLLLTLESLASATVPEAMRVTAIVVDNSSKDLTKDVVEEFRKQALPVKVEYVLEDGGQGLSYARNAGIRAGTGELIGFIDDHEEIDRNWYQVINSEFTQDPALEYMGGPYLPKWGAAAPAWLPPDYKAAVGIVEPISRAIFNRNFKGILMGGNSIIRRTTLNRVGLYSIALGRSGKKL